MRYIVSGIENVFSGFSSIDDDFYDELEEILIMGDIGVRATEEIIEEINFDPYDGIRAVIDRKYKNINDEKIRRRAVAALQRLGYGWDDIKTVLREYTEED